MSFCFRGHYNQTLLCNKKIKVEDVSCAHFDRLACLTGSLAKYVMTTLKPYKHLRSAIPLLDN
jgi:hypothetical protein